MKKGLAFLVSVLVATLCFAQNFPKEENSQDFFPIAVWLQNPSNAEAYKELGINMFVGIWGGLDQNKLNVFKNTGIKVICDQNEFGLKNLSEKTIYAWMHGDEPDNAQWNNSTKSYDPCIDPAIIINDYNKIKANDPSRPVYLNLGRGVSATNWVGRGECSGKTEMYKVSEEGYLKGCDIASYDIYPVNSSEHEVKDSLWYVAKGIDNLLEWSDYSKPVWCWIETTKIDKDSDRKPTPAEVKSQVWMALIHGASGVGYFCHSFHPVFEEAAILNYPEMAKEIRAINQQVTELSGILNGSTTNQFATVSSSNTKVPVDILTKNAEGADYIFSVAMKPGNTTAVFSIKKGKKIEVLGENRTIKAENGKFSDDFSDYAVHLYKITP